MAKSRTVRALFDEMYTVRTAAEMRVVFERETAYQRAGEMRYVAGYSNDTSRRSQVMRLIAEATA